jgi:hypothetical protein
VGSGAVMNLSKNQAEKSVEEEKNELQRIRSLSSTLRGGGGGRSFMSSILLQSMGGSISLRGARMAKAVMEMVSNNCLPPEGFELAGFATAST